MKINTIKQLIELVMRNNISELEVRSENDYVKISTNKEKTHDKPNNEIIKECGLSESKETDSKKKAAYPLLDEMDTYIRSPIAGTVYLSPDPYQENFVEAGQKISDGDTLCLIESMKTFTKISSYNEGTITKCLVENGQNVEAKQVLFVIKRP